jgi:hypothetical protein
MCSSAGLLEWRFGFAEKGNALDPQLQRLPVNAQDDAKGHQWESGQRLSAAGRWPVLRPGRKSTCAADHRLRHHDRCAPAPCRATVSPAAPVKAEAVVAGNVHEWRDVEHLAPLERLAVADRSTVGVREQVVVALTEGVVDFGKHGQQFAGTVVTEPQADRIEDETEDTRKTLQPDLAVGPIPSRCSSWRTQGSGCEPSRAPWSAKWKLKRFQRLTANRALPIARCATAAAGRNRPDRRSGWPPAVRGGASPARRRGAPAPRSCRQFLDPRGRRATPEQPRRHPATARGSRGRWPPATPT